MWKNGTFRGSGKDGHLQCEMPALCDPVDIRHGPPRARACAGRGMERALWFYILYFLFLEFNMYFKLKVT